ncbi:MAG TPA: PVC-type heme-binding CxxCH protein [Chryseolinea sp.]|nr:PVC-type heme-binding CxxCH protein [Chryseolinea sp.]
MLKKILFFSAFLILLNCEQSGVKRNFDSLTEDQKRLAENALSSMQTADGLEVELFAAEPMVTNPTNISVDPLGRVWVCEAYNYDVAPDQADPKGDRIVVLEDTDRDGKADKRTVFYQGTDLLLPLGVMVLGDKIYVTCSPNVFVFTDANKDLIPERKDVLFTRMSKGEHSTHSMTPGPDGMIYFSIGNYTRNIVDNAGNPLIDKSGFTVSQSGDPYLGGMVIRCTADGKNIEVLGHNFRNNYEPCVDSYGNVWQSDNDDDGNESSRINFVMYYGNYGFLDEMSGATWTANRINLEKTIPERHWHQGDPGVIPNVLITGAGSPAGMTFYEGNLLPTVFRNTPIHAEPYHNVVRAYLPSRKGAGYTLEIEDLLKSKDKWFRPIDVATAPDGSLFIADWYDPILGGGAAADAVKGRIFRVAPEAAVYSIPVADLSTVSGTIEAIKSPNPETQYIAFQKLVASGPESLAEVEKMWKSDNDAFRARALWILAKMDTTNSFLQKALADKNIDIRIAAVRAVVQNKTNVVPYLSSVVRDDNVAVRREAALALRYAGTPEAADLWVELAKRYDGKDRWYLEALGIGSDLHADLFFETWSQRVPFDVKNKVHQDIIWRSRSKYAIPLLADIIRNTTDSDLYQRFLRAFDFHNETSKNVVLASLVGLDRPDGKELTALALRQMDGSQVNLTPALKKAIKDALEETSGTIAYVNLVEKFSLKDKRSELLKLAKDQGDEGAGPAAIDVLLKFQGENILRKALLAIDTSSETLLRSLKGKGGSEIVSLISDVIQDDNQPINLRKTAVQILGSSWPGEERLLALVKESRFDPLLKPAAAGVLFNVYRSRIQREAAQYLSKPGGKDNKLPAIKQLLASSGNSARGHLVFKTHCASCHKVKHEGVKFGPELTLIGDKLSKEGLYRAILYPDEGVSYGYESTLVRLMDGSESMGIIANETAEEMSLNLPGGASVKYAKSKVAQSIKDDKSLMPALAGSMTQQELVDLVEFLSYLKR